MIRRIFVATIGLVLLSIPAAYSAEPVHPVWVDAKLKVTAGLTLWLDATRLNDARLAKKAAPLKSDEPVETWPDGSGRGWDFSQPEAAARPTFYQDDSYQAVRFDGEKSWLASAAKREPLRELTIFVVSAPFSNPGEFRALVAMNEKGKNDFVTGLTVDQGPWTSPRLAMLNVEGAGFGGARNLLTGAHDFATLRRLCVTSAVGAGGTRLYVDGKVHGQRDRAASQIRLDEIRVGARYYELGGPPITRGFFDGDICELLVYNHVLTDAERADVESYLAAKYGESRKVAPPLRATVGKRLVSVADPPAVQMFVPGFAVRELPVDLTNINNVLYRRDGKLVALAYNGRVYLLSDTDNDGLEDKAEVFWENKLGIQSPIGMALTPDDYKHGSGLFLVCKGKCLLVVDTDGDDRSDKEIVIAQGWKELPHGVDALGVAYNERDGSVYLGLGCTDYTNAYQVGQGGKAAYSLDSERGTILRIAPDFASRRIVATGIRFPVALRFNLAGDLFCTDQEGATWLANGNPLDELLHIQEKRHYGFPPRHPKHLPSVIDEPSLFDYAPQHQSLCGLNFNEPANQGRSFGPGFWQYDALAAGYSRGKLYRTKLVRSAAGYVAQTQLLASLNMLAADVCVSPPGNLVIAAHSGGPDWGSGPEGKGKLYQVSYTGQHLPQPVLAWAAGPREVRITFDRPLDPAHLKDVAKNVSIEFGKHVAAGDRFESLRPGYKVVQDQLRTPRFDLPVQSVQLTGDRRTLILATARHAQQGGYAITLAGLGRESAVANGALPQVPETDLRYDLSGVDAAWESASRELTAACWLPHLDLDVSRAFTKPSAPHDELWRCLANPGTLVLTTRLNLANLLRPAVQPGSQIDYAWPREDVTLVLRSKQPFTARHSFSPEPTATARASTPQRSVATDDGAHRVTIPFGAATDAPVPLEVRLTTGSDDVDLRVSYVTSEDSRERPLPLARLLLPWAPSSSPEVPTHEKESVPELAGGNWSRGRVLFFSEEGACSKCHQVTGQGGKIGPDLSNLPHRDYHSVVRDVAQPSYAINPDFITNQLVLVDGRTLSGVVRTEGDKLFVGSLDGKITSVQRSDVELMRISPTSTMPEGVLKQLGPEKTRDLFTFLLAEPPRMPDYGKGEPPPARSADAVKAVLAGAAEKPKTRPIHVTLVWGKKDHGPGEHDYPAWKVVWERLLSMTDDIKVTTAEQWPGEDDLKQADVLVFYQQGTWTPERAKAIDAFLTRGGGLVYIHYAVDGGADAPGFAKRIGLAWKGGESRFRHGGLDLDLAPGKTHPIARNFDKVHFHDESYWRLTGDPKAISLLATGVEDGQPQPLFWTLEPSKGRVFVSIPGHFSWTFDDPLFRILLLRGIAWTAREPVDRFNDLVTPGARLK